MKAHPERSHRATDSTLLRGAWTRRVALEAVWFVCLAQGGVLAGSMARLELSGPAELRVIEGCPIVLPLTLRNTGQKDFRWRPWEDNVRDIKDYIFIKMDRLGAAGEVVSSRELWVADHWGGAVDYVGRNITVQAGASAPFRLNLRAWVSTVSAGRYQLRVRIELPNRPVLQHEMCLMVKQDREELRKQLARIEEGLLDDDDRDDAESRERLGLYDPRYTTWIYLRVLEEAMGPAASEGWGRDILSHIYPALRHGWVDEPTRLVEQLAAIASDPQTPPAIGRLIHVGMDPLLLDKEDPALQAALKEHFGTVARVLGGNEDVEEKDLPPSAPESPTATQAPAKDEARAHEPPPRHWTLLVAGAVTALIAFGAGLLVGWLVGRRRHAARPESSQAP